jgi:uncharacterized protein YpmB
MKVIVISLVLTLVAGSASASYDEVKAKVKGASAQAMERASENSVFNRVTDWFATVGKSPEEKTLILAERNAKRMSQKSAKSLGSAYPEAKKKIGALQDKMNKQADAWK